MHDAHSLSSDGSGAAVDRAPDAVESDAADAATTAIRRMPLARLGLDQRTIARLAFLGVATAGALHDASDDALLSAAATDDAVLEQLMRLRWTVRRWLEAIDAPG